MPWREVFREPLFCRLFRGGLTIICTADGFSVASPGRPAVGYRWTQVVRTCYRPEGHFLVETNVGACLSVSAENRWCRELIAVFSAMTPHLPYVWVPQTGSLTGPVPFTAVPRA